MPALGEGLEATSSHWRSWIHTTIHTNLWASVGASQNCPGVATKSSLLPPFIFLIVLLCSYSGSWTIITSHVFHWRIDAFELWCWRRLLRVPWTARRSNQSILKEINPELKLKLNLKFQYFGCLIQRADSLEKTLMLGKIEGKRRRGQERMR